MSRYFKRILYGRLKAGFTLEAAVILPTTMLLTVTLLFLGFYIHDRIAMTSVSISAVLEAAGEENGSGEIRTRVQNALLASLIRTGDLSVALSEEGEDVQLSCSASFDWHFALAKTLAGSGSDRSEISVCLSRLDGRSTLLKYKLIADGFHLLSGESE